MSAEGGVYSELAKSVKSGDTLSRAELVKMVSLMRDGEGAISPLSIMDRKWRFKTYKTCFVGKEATSWLCTIFGIDRAAAVRIGQRLVDCGFFAHVVGDHQFQDKKLFYKLIDASALSDIDEGLVSRVCTGLLGAVPIRNRNYKGIVYLKCFVAAEAITWLVASPFAAPAGCNASRSKAADFLDQFRARGLITHVRYVGDKHDHQFEDSPDSFFRVSPTGRQRSASSLDLSVQPLNGVLGQRLDVVGVPPLIRSVMTCIVSNSANCLCTEGLFRVSAASAAADAFAAALDQKKEENALNLTGIPHIWSHGLKLWLREMGTPLLGNSEMYIKWVELGDAQEGEFENRARALMAALPEFHVEVLEAVAYVCRTVAAREDANRMGMGNLTLVIAPNILATADYNVLSDAFAAIESGRKVVEKLFKLLNNPPPYLLNL